MEYRGGGGFHVFFFSGKESLIYLRANNLIVSIDLIHDSCRVFCSFVYYSTFNRNFHDCIQLMGETILLVGSISLGLVAYLVADIRLRRAFLDTRQSFEMRLTIEGQAREQVKPKSHSIARTIKLMSVSLTRVVVCRRSKNKKRSNCFCLSCPNTSPSRCVRTLEQLTMANSKRSTWVETKTSGNIFFFFFFELNVYFFRWWHQLVSFSSKLPNVHASSMVYKSPQFENMCNGLF